jgi:2,3-bisphosphoglycerate-independent phosphoglycerate mutase
VPRDEARLCRVKRVAYTVRNVPAIALHNDGWFFVRRVIFLFLDGVGLGANDPASNPLVAGEFPTLKMLLDGAPLVGESGRLSTPYAELVPTDAHMGIAGRPQSATGQAAILTGINAPQRLGEHYGPRPDDRVRQVIDEGNLFRRVREAGKSFFFCNAYPHGYFAAVRRGKRLLSAVPYAATSAGQPLLNADDLQTGRAIAADFTNQGWRDVLGYENAPVLTPEEGGALVWELAQPHDFLFFEHWYSDELGHRQDLDGAVANFSVFDGFLGGLLAAADMEETLVIVASDHGNVEDCSHGKHTENPALTLLLGGQRQAAAERINALTDFAPVVLDYLAGTL